MEDDAQALNQHHIEIIEEGIRQADAGMLHSHEEVWGAMEAPLKRARERDEHLDWTWTADGGWRPPDSLTDLKEMPEITEAQWALAVQGPYLEVRKILRARREAARAAKEAEGQ